MKHLSSRNPAKLSGWLKIACISSLLALTSASHADTRNYTGQASITHDQGCDLGGASRSLFSINSLATELTTVSGSDDLKRQTAAITLNFTEADGLDFTKCTYSLSIETTSGGLIAEGRFTSQNVTKLAHTTTVILDWDTSHTNYGPTGTTSASVTIVLNSRTRT